MYKKILKFRIKQFYKLWAQYIIIFEYIKINKFKFRYDNNI